MANILRKGLGFDFKAIGEQTTTIDPIIDFTRASTATRISPITDGLVESVAANVVRINGQQELWKAGSKNIFQYSNDFTGWSKSAGLAIVIRGLVNQITPNDSWYAYKTFATTAVQYTLSFTGRCVTTPQNITVGAYRTSNDAALATTILAGFTTTAQRFTFTFTALDTSSYIVLSGGNFGSVEVSDVQIETGASATTYEPNPAVIQPGALLEGVATNQVVTVGGWSASGTLTNNYGTAPDGSNTSTRLQGGGYVVATVNHTGVNVLSVWVKAPTSGVLNLLVGAAQLTVSVGTSWRRVYATSPDNGTAVYLANLPSDVEVWGAQLEPGTFPSSYIPTAGAPVTRAADNASIDVSKLWHAQEGTLVVETDFGPVASSSSQTAVNGASTGELSIYTQNGTLIVYTIAGYLSTPAPSGRTRIAVSYINGATKAYANGVLVGSGIFTINTATLRLGSRGAGDSPLNSPLQYLAYHRFAMDDYTLKALSTIK